MWVYFLREKAQAFGKFKEWLQLIENETRKRVIKFKSNGGGEFVSNEFEDFCRSEGIMLNAKIEPLWRWRGVC